VIDDNNPLLSLRDGIEAIGQPVFVVARDGQGTWRYELANEELCATPGFEAARIIGSSPRELLGESDGATIEAQYGQCLESGDRHTFELSLPVGGVQRWWRVVTKPLGAPSPDGRPRLIGTATDITTSKLDSDRLAQQNTLLRIQQETSPDGVVLIDNDRMIRSWNERYTSMWGIPEAVARNGTLDAARAYVLPQLADPEGFLDRLDHFYENPHVHEAGTEVELRDGRVFERYSSGLPDGRGGYWGRIWFYRDVSARRQAETAVRDSEARLRDVAEQVPGALFQWRARRDGVTALDYISPYSSELCGLEPAELLADWSQLPIHPEDQDRYLQSVEAAVRRRSSWEFDGRILKPDGELRWIRCRSKLTQQTGEQLVYTGIILDVTAEQRAQRALAASERRFRQLVEGSIQGIVVCRPDDARLLFVNAAAERIFDLENRGSPESSQGSLQDLLSTKACKALIRGWSRRESDDGNNRSAQICARTASGRTIWLDTVASLIEWSGARAVQITLIDVTDRHDLEQDLRRLASTDSLTGLLNRRQFTIAAQEAIDACRLRDAGYVLLMIDADHFKAINDSHGHAVGDRVLRRLATVLSDSVRDLDVVGRMGGEEFAALLPRTCLEDAHRVAERIRVCCSRAHLDDQAAGGVAFAVSVGVAADAEGALDLEELMIRADRALYRAKESGRNQVMVAG